MKWYWWALGFAAVVIGVSQVNRVSVMKDLKKVILGKNFTLDEFVQTSTGVENIPGPVEVQALMDLVANILQPLRDALGVPITVTSGYRSPAVNALTPGSSDTSQHTKGQAADIVIAGMTNQQIIDKIRSLRLPYDQLIDEEKKRLTGGVSRWVHVSFNNTKPVSAQRLQWMTRRDPGLDRPKEYETVKYGYA